MVSNCIFMGTEADFMNPQSISSWQKRGTQRTHHIINSSDTDKVSAFAKNSVPETQNMRIKTS